MKKILTIAIFLITAPIAFGQAGAKDSSFGIDGESLILTNSKSTGSINDIEQQPDGKIVAAGEEYYSTQVYNAIVVRYKTDGTRDSSFGENGFADVSIKSDHKFDAAMVVKVLNDGKILVLINAQNLLTNDPDIYLVKLNTDGSKDTSFGNDGVTVKNIGIDYGYAMQIQDDGKILLGGQINSVAALARFNADGSTDTSFNNTGLILLRSTMYSYISAIAFTSSKKILIGGSGRRNITSHDESFVSRYNMNGQPDTGFGINGSIIKKSSYSQSITSLVVLAGDAFLVSSFLFDDVRFFPVSALSKYNADGSVDNTFGKNGLVTSGIPETFLSYRTAEIAVQQDGKIILAGQFMNEKAKYAISVTRLLPNGESDKSFGNNGNVLSYHYYNKVTCMLIQQDGKIVVGGCIQQTGNSKLKLSLVRYLSGNNSITALKQNNIDAIKNVSIYPNPVKDILHINGLEGKNITIINIQGSVNKRLVINSDTYNLYTNNFAKGIYFIKVDGNNNASTYKFEKQ